MNSLADSATACPGLAPGRVASRAEGRPAAGSSHVDTKLAGAAADPDASGIPGTQFDPDDSGTRGAPVDPAKPATADNPDNPGRPAAPHPGATAARPELGPGRVALGIAYRGHAYHGWQSQPDGRTVQDLLERALARFAGLPKDAIVSTLCAGRTDAGVHALNQVVHFDAPVAREEFSWVRGTNRYLPQDIAVQWARHVPSDFHARNGARGRKYAFLVRESVVRPALEAGLCGWVFRPLALDRMRQAAAALIGEHDFSSFRSSRCQALSPVKELRRITIARIGDYWRFDFEASAFLHHMVRNLMGALIAIGGGHQPPEYMAELLARRDRRFAPPTFAAAGLYFLGPRYDPHLALPERTSAHDWLPQVPPEYSRPDEGYPRQI